MADLKDRERGEKVKKTHIFGQKRNLKKRNRTGGKGGIERRKEGRKELKE